MQDIKVNNKIIKLAIQYCIKINFLSILTKQYLENLYSKYFIHKTCENKDEPMETYLIFSLSIVRNLPK